MMDTINVFKNMYVLREKQLNQLHSNSNKYGAIIEPKETQKKIGNAIFCSSILYHIVRLLNSRTHIRTTFHHNRLVYYDICPIVLSFYLYRWSNRLN